MAKELKLWNGRGLVLNTSKLKQFIPIDDSDRNARYNRDVHMFIAAYSVADAVRLINEFNGYEGNHSSEIKEYFSKNCWGNRMEGITPERGIWVTEGYKIKPPVRII